MSQILIVDDDSSIRESIKKYLMFDGFGVFTAENGQEAVEAVKKGGIDLVIMDIMMPLLDGFTATKEIRLFSNVPILILSVRHEEFDRIHGFECGCDDYVAKPCSMKELVMRIAAILKRSGLSMPETKVTYQHENLFVDFTGRQVLLDGKDLILSPREYSLLFYLIKNKDIALSREKILNDVWGYDFAGDDRTIDTHIKQLRHRLGNFGKHISTIHGIGYRYSENE